MPKTAQDSTSSVTYIRLRGIREIHDNHDDTQTIVIATRPLDVGEREMLEALFPDMQSAVQVLLMKQAVLSSIVTDGMS